jgi:predicted AlkP superfamily pyrophosphatase or phosphodiesterase
LCAIAPLSAAPSAFAQETAGTTRVVIVSVDGLRPDAITAERTPRITELARCGVRANGAINDLPSATLPNHTTMLTGLSGDVHGVVLNFDLPGTVGFPTIFDYAAQAGLRSAFFAGKSKLSYLAPPSSVEQTVIQSWTPDLITAAVEALSVGGPDLIFVHIRDPDSTGHGLGWMSPEYLDAVAGADEQIGRLIDAASASARPTWFIVTADHGGDGNNHFVNISVNRTIPWIVCGPGAREGGLLEGVFVADTTPTALWLLGVTLPQGQSGRVQTAVLSDGDAAAGAPALDAPPISLPCVILLIPAAIALAFVARRA